MAYQRVDIEDIFDSIHSAALECFWCRERFKNPRSLPCIHVFCLECLEKLVKEGRLNCPICREDCQIPEDGLEKLPKSIFITGYLDYLKLLKQNYICACCCAEEARFACKICNKQYCKECKDAHRETEATRNHSIITIEDFKEDHQQLFKSQKLICSIHNMPFEFFCRTCMELACVDCAKVKHLEGDSHKLKSTENAFKTFKTNAFKLIEASDKKLEKFEKLVEDLTKMEADTNSNYEVRKTEIIKQAEELQTLITRCKDEQLKDLGISREEKLQKLGDNISNLKFIICKLSSMRGMTESLAKCPNHVMALTSSSDATKSLEKLLKEKEVKTVIKNQSLVKYDKHFKTLDFLKINFLRILGLNVLDRVRSFFRK